MSDITFSDIEIHIVTNIVLRSVILEGNSLDTTHSHDFMTTLIALNNIN